MASSKVPPYSSITEPPKTVKECIDWLLRIGRKDDTYYNQHSNTTFCEAVSALLGDGADISQEFNNLIASLQSLIGWQEKSANTGSQGPSGHSGPSGTFSVSAPTGQITGKGIGKQAGYISAYGIGEDRSLFKRCSAYKSSSGTCCEPPCVECDPNKDCPPSGCCDGCPKRISARIFCLVFPILNLFLNELQEKISKFKGWSEDKLKHPTKLSLYFTSCGFDPRQLNSTKTGADIATLLDPVLSSLESIQDIVTAGLMTRTDPTITFLSHSTAPITDDTKQPITVRDIMVWLYCLPYCRTFPELKVILNERCRDITSKNPTVHSGIMNVSNVMSSYADSICKFPNFFYRIEGSTSHFLKDVTDVFFNETTTKRYRYDISPVLLFSQFVEYTTIIYYQLSFLYVMCKTSQEGGGWQNCCYGKQQEAKNDNTKLLCECKHQGSNKQCSLYLKKFLQAESTYITKLGSIDGNKFLGLALTTNSQRKVFDIAMGFKDHLSDNYETGETIAVVLEALLDAKDEAHINASFNTSRPFSQLTQYVMALLPKPPYTLGDFIDVFRRLGDDEVWGMDKIKGMDAGIKKELSAFYLGTEGATKVDENVNAIKDCIKAIQGTQQHKENAHKDLQMLLGCKSPQENCASYVISLTAGVYKYFVPSLVKRESQKWLEWLFALSMGLYDHLEELRDELYDCNCCPNGHNKSCTGIIECPHCLPTLYRYGLVWGDSVRSKGKQYKCAELMAALYTLTDTTSTVYIACKKIILSVHDILLMRTLSIVTVQFSADSYSHLRKAYERYIKNAFSKCRVALLSYFIAKRPDDFKNIHFGAAPTSNIAIVSEQVTSISAMVPNYQPQCTDAFRYNDYANDNTKPYKFTNAMNFHIENSQCITPTPVALRSVIDWLLRMTVGDTENNNEHIKAICNKIDDVIGVDGSPASMEDNIKVIVNDLRDFIGYKDNTKYVKNKVYMELNGCSNSIKNAIKKISAYLNKHTEYGKEVGDALQKTPFTVSKERRTYTETLKQLQEKFKEPHTGCAVDLNCKTVKFREVTNTNSLPSGLDNLYTFFQSIDTLVKLRQSIESNTTDSTTNFTSESQEGFIGGDIKRVKNGPDGFFTKIREALKKLGECAELVKALHVNNGGSTVSDRLSKFKDSILTLLNALNNVVNVTLKSIPPEMVQSACNRLADQTKKAVEHTINKELVAEISNVFTKQVSFDLNIDALVEGLDTNVRPLLMLYQYHIDHLKKLCHWAYKVGLLFNAGLTNFIPALIQHVGHIYGIICNMEDLEEKINELRNITEVGHIKGSVEGLFQEINNAINSLLTSYVLHELPQGSQEHKTDKQKVKERRQFLTDLRLLALDRYTLQVWQDECNSQQCRIENWITFENGIVRRSGLDAIKEALSTLTRIAYSSNNPDAHSPTNRIHDFHSICVIQKFSYEAPIARLVRSLKELEGIKEKLEEVKVKCNEAQDGTQLQDDAVITTFCQSVTDFLQDPYGIYQFAKFVHTILGPNIFSAVIGALEELTTQKMNALKTDTDKKKKFCDIVIVMHEGLQSDKDTKDHYKLDVIIKKLNSFLDTLRKEYIFSYPMVTANKASLPAAPQTAQDPLPMTPSCISNDSHKNASICDACYPYLAKIFIGAIPNLYRHCRLLYEMCQPGEKWNDNLLVYSDNGNLNYHVGFISLASYLEREGYTVAPYADTFYPNEGYYELQYSFHGNQLPGNLKHIVSLNDPINTTDESSLKPLDKLFKAVMEHFRTKRKELCKEREEKERKAFESNPRNKESGLKYVEPPPQLPSTVRQVIFWLHELDANKVFYDGMSKHIEDLCNESSIGISHETILHVLKLSITQCLEVLATIEGPGRQFPTYLYDLYTEEHYYAYPTVNIPLFFYTFVEKFMGAFLELNFVCVQCEFRALEGGWSDCHIGKGVDGKEGAHCNCPPKSSPNPTSNNCPRPLYSFLFDNKTDLKVPAERKPYMSKGTMPCGFKLKQSKDTHTTATPTPTSRTGSVLVEPLKKLVGGHVTGRHNDTEQNTLRQVIYLRDMLRYVLCLAVRPPWSMSENMAFFYRVTEAWRNKVPGGVRVAQGNPKLLDGIHAEISQFPGAFDGELLTKALERFAGLADKDPEKKHETAASPPSHTNSHQYDLRTLMGCKENAAKSSGTTVQCSPFIFPLSLDVYTHYDEKNSRAYLSWILNFAFGIYGQLRGLQEMMKEQKCMRNASQSNASSCPSLPTCPGVLTALYQSGSSFMDQGQLAQKKNTTKKTCSQFDSVLHGFFNCHSKTSPDYCSPLHNLIVQCEAFLWSIRSPFSLVQLSLWSVAVLFISYVFVVPLDHFKIKSHLFNRLKYTMHPSLLIADGQRKVSEVAYFSL